MKVKFHILAACTGLTLMLPACASHRSELTVRPLGAPAPAGPVDAELQRARSLLASGQPGLAIPILRQLVRDSATSADAYNCLGVAYDALGRTDLALRYFEQAMAKAPLEQRYAQNLARLMAKFPGEASRSALAAAEGRPDILSVAIPAPSTEVGMADGAPRLQTRIVTQIEERGVHSAATAMQSYAHEASAAAAVLSSRGLFSAGTIALARGDMGFPLRTLPQVTISQQAGLTNRPLAVSRIERLSLGEVRLVTAPVMQDQPVRARNTVHRSASVAVRTQRAGAAVPKAVAQGSRQAIRAAGASLQASSNAKARRNVSLLQGARKVAKPS